MKTPLDVATISDHHGTVVVGDTVRVLPSKPGRHDAFTAVVREIHRTAAGTVEVTVAGVDVIRARDAIRVFTPDRLRRTRKARR